MIRALIVDDERLGRAGVRRLLAAFPDVEVAGEAADGTSAVEAIRTLVPDLVFLDVQMPGGDAFQVIRAIGADAMPAVVFVTAYDEHAVRAFEADAVDYLLKPIDPDRLADAVSRVKRRLRTAPSADLVARLETLAGRMTAGSGAGTPPERIPVDDGGRVRFVEVTALDWLESNGNYLTLHLGARSYRLRGTLEAMEKRLGPGFVRVGRSVLVNRQAIEAAEHFVKGSWVLFLRSGTKIRTSRHYRDRLDGLLGGRFRGG